MTGSVLVLNAGSSSLKYQVLDAGEQTEAGGTVERVDETGWDDAFDEVTSAMAEAGVDPGDLLAVGHRVVHGGDRYTERRSPTCGRLRSSTPRSSLGCPPRPRRTPWTGT